MPLSLVLPPRVPAAFLPQKQIRHPMRLIRFLPPLCFPAVLSRPHFVRSGFRPPVSPVRCPAGFPVHLQALSQSQQKFSVSLSCVSISCGASSRVCSSVSGSVLVSVRPSSATPAVSSVSASESSCTVSLSSAAGENTPGPEEMVRAAARKHAAACRNLFSYYSFMVTSYLDPHKIFCSHSGRHFLLF